MGKVIFKRQIGRKPITPPQYSGDRFTRFLDDILQRGLETVGLFYGVYRAIVVSNEDHENPGKQDPQGRLVIRVPILGDDERTKRLAYPIVPSAGKGYGFKSLPSPGEHVYVMFEHGNPSMPLWIGQWWARGEIPDEDSQNHVWVSPKGMRVELRDGEEKIVIKHVSGSVVEMDSSGNITINDASGNVYIGSKDREPGVLGYQLLSIMQDLLRELTRLTVPTGTGPSGPPINSPAFASISAKLRKFLSDTVYLSK